MRNRFNPGLVAVALCVVAVSAQGQSLTFEGLTLNKPKKADGRSARPSDAGVPMADGGVMPRPELADGAPIVAMPPFTAGQVDVPNFRELYAALRARVGNRLVAEDQTLAALARLKLNPEKMKTEGPATLAAALKADFVVVFVVAPAAASARLLALAGATAAASATVPLPKKGTVSRQQARELVGELIAKGRTTLEPQSGLDLTATGANGEAPADTVDEPELEVKAAPRTEAPKAMTPTWLSIFVGGGTSFRSLGVTTSGGPIVPQTPAVIGSLGGALKLFPLLLVPALRDSRFSEAWLEGRYRFSLVRGVVVDGEQSTSCPAIDDEVVGRVGWRYRFGGMLPHVGVTVGVANERTVFRCAAPALDTTYTSTEYHLSVWQPILPSQSLFVELAGGPRVLFSTRARGFDTFAWSAEGWLTARPAPIFTLRAGARVTGTRLTTYPDAVSLTDLRTFIGLEVGAAL